MNRKIISIFLRRHKIVSLRVECPVPAESTELSSCRTICWPFGLLWILVDPGLFWKQQKALLEY